MTEAIEDSEAQGYAAVVGGTLFSRLYRHRRYIRVNALRDLVHRYAGSVFGAFWSVLMPAMEVLIYTVVFGRLMRQHADVGARTGGFVLYLCAGLFPWIGFSTAVTRGSLSFVENAVFLKKLPLPEEIFTAKAVLSETINTGLYLLLIAAGGALLCGTGGLPLLALPALLLLFQTMAFGISLGLAPLRVFFPDVSHVLGLVLRLWMWLSPVAYAADTLGPRIRDWLQWNPAYFFITSFQDVLMRGRWPSLLEWTAMAGWSSACLLAGLRILNRVRSSVRDAL